MTDVVVVGGGIVGLMAAWRLAQQGDHVTVVDPAPGTGASWVAAGMLAPVTEAHLGEAELLALNREAATRWPATAAELADVADQPVELRAHGTVVVGADADDRAHLDDLAERLDLLGLAVDRLRGPALRRRVPALAPSVAGGLDVAGDHAVDNRQVVGALRRATERAGVGLRRRCVSAVAIGDDAVDGVVLDDDSRIGADVVVVAAGSASGRLGLPVPVPVRGVRGEVLRLRDDGHPPLLSRTVRGWAHGRPVYLVPRGSGELVVGATSEERDHDTVVTAGGVLDLLTAARDLVPGVRELAVEEVRAGLRPGTPDNLPLVGPTALPGLVLATGHFRHGVLQAPLAAEAVAHTVRTGALPAGVDAADPRRFTA